MITCLRVMFFSAIITQEGVLTTIRVLFILISVIFGRSTRQFDMKNINRNKFLFLLTLQTY